MKPEIDSRKKLDEWLLAPAPAIFQGQDLLADSQAIAALPLQGCVFLGCRMDDVLAKAAATSKCLVIPDKAELKFKPFTPGLYTPDELYNKFDPDNATASYKKCLDYEIYDSVTQEVVDSAGNPVLDSNGKPKREPREFDIDDALMHRIHDWSIGEALDDLLSAIGYDKCVAIMGGHDAARSSAIYSQTAMLALELSKQGFTIVTGGGPGLMEAANLGAYSAGFGKPEHVIATAIQSFKHGDDCDTYNSPGWLEFGFNAWKSMGKPKDVAQSRNIGIPTWFYGFEPPNVFATDIAKYFENSVREEGLLAVARGGVIYAEGNGGTVQEIFQDANQNYYRTYGKAKSPMVLYDTGYWNPGAVNFNNPKKDKRKPAYLLLHKLATEKNFDDYVFVSDDAADIVDFISKHPPVG